MVARSKKDGRDIIYDEADKVWKWEESGKEARYTIDDIKDWIKEIVPAGNTELFTKEYEGGESDGKKTEHRYNTALYTDNYIYSISAHTIVRGEGKDYIGCIMSCRKHDAGEDWNRGRDLPDGELNRDTWNDIKNAIIKNELVQLSNYSRNPPNHEDEALEMKTKIRGEK